MSSELMEKNDSAVAEIRPVVTPMDMLNMAMQQGADLDKMQQLMDMQERWEASEAKKAYDRAVTGFKKNIPDVVHDMENKQFKSTYASKTRLVNTISPALAMHGLTTRWTFPETDNATIKVCCEMSHELGHSEQVCFSGPPDKSGSKNPIQEMKSTITYLEIITFEAVTGVATKASGGNDDGNIVGAAIISQEQSNIIYAMISDNELDMGKFMGWLNRTLKCDSIEAINVNGYDLAIRTIEQTIKNKAAKQ